MNNRHLVLAVMAFLCGLAEMSFAQSHKGMSFQGVIKLPNNEYPTASGVTVQAKILAPNGCILRAEEFQGVNISNGYINLVIGAGTATSDDPGLSLKQVMDNSGIIANGPSKPSGLVCLDANGNVTGTTSFDPSGTSGVRKFRVELSVSSMPVKADFNMRAVAYAVNSESLNGKTQTDFLNINNTKNLTQANAESIFERFTKLDALLNNSNSAGTSLGVNITGNAATATNITGGINALLPTQTTNAGKYLKTDGTNVTWETVAGGGGGSGLTQVGIDLPTSVFVNSADITANGKVTSTFAAQNAKTFFAGPSSGSAVPSFRTLTSGDIGSFATDVNTLADARIVAATNVASGIAGLDASTKIPLALLPNDAVFSSSVKTGVLKLSGPTTTEIQLSAPTSGLTSYNMILPTAAGTAGQVLKIDTVSGSNVNLLWGTVTSSGGTLTSVGLSLPTDVFQVTGSPLTADGSISASLKSQTQKQVLAAPNAADGAPGFRQLQVSDLSNAKTAALYDVPVTGDAGTTQVVKGDDSRLIDARSPIDNSVTTAKIANGAVTDAKIDSLAASKLTGSIDVARLPAASNAADGIVNQIAQSFKGVKTFIDNVIMQGTLSVTGAFSAASATISGAISAASISTSGNVTASGDVTATGAVAADRIKVANSSATCNASIEGSLKYNTTSKKMEYCNGTSWTNISSGTQANLSIGSPSTSIVKSGPVTFLVTYGSGADTATISLATGNVTLGGTDTSGCSVASVTGSGSTRTVSVNGCTGTGTVNISIAAGTASSTTGDAAPAAGPSTTYQVDNTGPTAPTGVTLGSVPSNLTNSPTITYSAASDVGGSTVGNHQVKIIKTSDSSIAKDWANHTSGSDVGSLTLATNTQYSVLVRAVDALTNIGAETTAVNWTTINDPCLATPAIGTTCTGGALYLGQFDGGKYMVTPSGCTNSTTPTCAGGTDATTRYWNDGSTNWYDIPAVETFTTTAQKSSSSYRGNVNTDAIIAYHGTAANAAKYCQDMVYGGYSDWYLPSKSELAYMYCKATPTGTHDASYPQEEANCVAYGGKQSILTGFAANYYWSSTEYTSNTAWIQNFNDGIQYTGSKTTAYPVRCLRRY